jgi:hypothetical protein
VDFTEILNLVDQFGWKLAIAIVAGRLLWKHGGKWLEAKVGRAELEKFGAKLRRGYEIAEQAYDAVANLRRDQERRGVDADRDPANGIELPAKPTRGQLRAAAIRLARKLLPGVLTEEEWGTLIDHVHEKRRAAELAAAQTIENSLRGAVSAFDEMQQRINAAMAKQKALGWESGGTAEVP